jgi:hypothetical protein
MPHFQAPLGGLYIQVCHILRFTWVAFIYRFDCIWNNEPFSLFLALKPVMLVTFKFFIDFVNNMVWKMLVSKSVVRSSYITVLPAWFQVRVHTLKWRKLFAFDFSYIFLYVTRAYECITAVLLLTLPEHMSASRLFYCLPFRSIWVHHGCFVAFRVHTLKWRKLFAFDFSYIFLYVTKRRCAKNKLITER